MKILKFLAIISNIAQIAFIIYFLAVYSTDNFPFFVFLFFVPMINCFVFLTNDKVCCK